MTTDDMIASLVSLTHGGAADLLTQHWYRQALQGLVMLAKAEQRQETSMDLLSDGMANSRNTMH